MPVYRIKYFEEQTMAESTRFILAYHEIPFEEDTIKFELSTFVDHIAGCPALFVDEKSIRDSDAMVRYAAKMCGLIPEDEFDAAICEGVFSSMTRIVRVFLERSHWINGVPDEGKRERKKVKLEAETLEKLTPVFQRIEELIKGNGGKYILGSEISWADLSVAYYIGHFQHALDLRALLKSFPKGKKLKKTVFEIPSIKKWIDELPTPFGVYDYSSV